MSFFSEERSAELRDLFFESAAELLQALNDEGLQLEKSPEDAEVGRRVRRTVHTLKGDSAAAGYPGLSELAHELEDALTADLGPSARGELAELVLRAADSFGEMLSIYRRGQTPEPQDHLRAQIRNLAARKNESDTAVGVHVPYKLSGRFAWSEYEQLLIQDAMANGQTVFNVAVALEPACPGPVALQMVRTALQQAGAILALFPEEATSALDVVEAAVATARDSAFLDQKCRIPAVTTDVIVKEFATEKVENPAEDPEVFPAVESLSQETAIADKPSRADQPAPASPELASRLTARESTLRVDAARIDTALNLVGELIIGKSMLTQSIDEFERRFPRDPLRAKLTDSLAFLARTLSDLQKSVMKIRMVPVEQLFRRFPRVVRDVSKACGKEVELLIKGEDTDLDKSILDLLAEPLSHIVRNAIDHGVEAAEERAAQNKQRGGTVTLNAYHQGNHIVIECADDGRGIDRQKLVAKAIERGVTTVEEAAHMTETEALGLVFHPGLSTAEQVTQISGRGVGMDVVKSVLERLKGTVSIESQVGQGTTFRLKVPLTLAIIKALMFRVGDRFYAVPLASVVEITRTRPSEIHRVDQLEVLQLRGEVLTLVRLEKLSQRSGPAPQKSFVVVISHAERKFGLVVDTLVGEEELVIKALDDHLVATEFVSGASILGDGSVVLILNIQTLVAKLSRAEVSELEVSA